MSEKNIAYRLEIYSQLAFNASQKHLKWIVLHGSEGYPLSIGRDLDVLCEGEQESKKAISLFLNVCRKHPKTRWIIVPHPIWGKRVLGISSDYEVAELHILNKINSGIIDYRVDFNKIDYNSIFPQDKEACFFKSFIMPLLGNSKKVIERISEDELKKLSPAIIRAYRKIASGSLLSFRDKVKIYRLYMTSFSQCYKNLIYTINVKRKVYKSPTTPLVLFENYDQKKLETLKGKLNEVFLDFRCGDSLSKSMVQYHRARQRLVYITQKKKGIVPDLIINDLSSEKTPVQIMDKFSSITQCYNVYE